MGPLQRYHSPFRVVAFRMRNAVLGRTTTPQEQAFIDAGGLGLAKGNYSIEVTSGLSLRA